MATRKITLGSGVAALEVSPIGYGAMGLTAFYGDHVTPEQDAVAVLRKAYDLGVRHFDTAQIYQRKDAAGVVHYNEELVGKFLTTLSDEEKKDVSVATKYLPNIGTETPTFETAQFREATEASLKRLGVDCIDLYYFHRVVPSTAAKLEVWMGEAKKLVEEGMIKRVGLSEASSQVIKAANAIYPITCVQQEWSLFARDLEESVVPTCRELGIGIVSYSPIGRGILAGSFAKKEERPSDWRTSIPYLSEENIDKNLALIEEIKAIAAAKNCTLGQLCLAWVMAKGSVPIPGTTKIHHLEDNMGAVNVTLTPEEIEKLGELGNKVAGIRGDESYMKASFKILR